VALEQRIKSDGPKKILSLDGGGIRGTISIEILARIEELLREKLKKDAKFVLGDYFDFISGTSTGAIIATCLSLGMTVGEVRDFYLESGREMFNKASLRRRIWYKYEEDNLTRKLKEIIGAETTLGTERLRTLLMLVMRNATTDSPWPISNNPVAKYNHPDRRINSGDCNLDFPLWQLVRASTAAPIYFPPEVIPCGKQDFIFVDGGVTVYNNPAFQTFLMATFEPYKVCWPAGENKILVVSVGTGMNAEANKDLQPEEMNIIYNATSIPSALMFAALNEQDLLCRVFGKCLSGDMIDREVGDCIGKKGPVEPKLFTYVRYNLELSRNGLDALGLTDIDPKTVQKLDSTDYIGDLQRIGVTFAEQKVKADHFAGFSS
jgi:uncharacterized protein